MRDRKYTLWELTLYFLRLGSLGFGGPVALVGYMYRDLVEQKGWFTEEEYKEGLALAQLAPGPLAAQLGIYIGFVHYGLLGATLVGLAFVLPSFIMVVGLGIAYRAYGGLPWVRDVFYGVGAAVIGIITVSAYKLTIKSLGRSKLDSLKRSWMLWLFYVMAVVVTVATKQEQVMMFIACGLLYMLVKAPPDWLVRPKKFPIFILGIAGFWDYSRTTLVELGLFFLKAGTFVFGSGLAIVPFLQAGVVVEHGWLNEEQFIDAVAVAMVSPGPVVITVGFIGYLVNGFPGAAIAALATFLPCYLFTVTLAPFFKRIAQNNSVKAFVDGITAPVIGSLAGAVIVISGTSIVDVATAIIAIGVGITLIYVKNIKEPVIIFIAMLLGILIKNL